MNNIHALSMSRHLAALAASALFATVGLTQNFAQDTKTQIVERGPHHRVWERTVTDKLPNGRTVERKSSFTELATGMHYQDERGEWIESREEIEIFNGAAVARQGQVQAIWSADLNTEGAVDMLTSDGKRFRSHILGLAYTDAVSGKSVLIAEPKSSIGEVVGNQVFYRDAFAGPFRADVRYTYTKAGVSQDILIREGLPSPREYGLDEERSRIEVWTEFTTAAAPTKSRGVLKTEADPLTRQLMVDPDLTDETLDFGTVRIGPGSAFPMEPTSSNSFEKESAPVGKSWLQLDGRTFLIEKIDLRDIREQLNALPKSAALNDASKVRMQAAAESAAPRQQLLAGMSNAVRKEARRDTGVMRMAAMVPPEKGFVLDYSLVSSATNFTFKGGTTYYVSGNVTLSGTTVIEGGAVIKYTNTIVAIQGPVDCRTDVYRPAFFLSKNDNGYGEAIPGSTGNPTTNYYGSRCLDFTGNTNAIDLHNLHFRSSFHTIYLHAGGDVTVRHSQFAGCFAAVVSYSGGKVRLRNVLIHDGEYGIGGGNLTNIHGEHLTAHRLKYLISSSSMSLTNSAVLAVTNNVKYTGVNVLSNSVDTGYFQILGGGSRYWVNSSTNRNAGTTNINSGLLADLKRMTTEPPKTLFTNLTVNTNLIPVIAGDTTSGDLPDLGYHYPIIDYLASGALINDGVTVVATNGVNIAVDYSQDDWGFRLLQGKLISQGSADATNRIFRAHMVQETDTPSSGGAWAMFYDMSDDGAAQTSQARFRFTEIIQLPSDGYVLYSGRGLSALELTHSSLYGPSFVVDITGSSTLVAGLTNSLIDGGGVQFGAGGSGPNTTVHFRNNLFRNATLHFLGGTTNWTVRDNVFFDMSTNLNDHGNPLQNSFNAYYGTTNQYFTGGTSNLLTTNLAYEVGPRGRYHLPSGSSLINGGSRAADQAGLFHFTTATNQVKETNSTVDVGLHYVALNGSGQPVDSDGDGLADYIEDANGNGFADGSENSHANPVLTVVSTMNYIKGGPAKRFDTNAIAYDSDSTNFGGGKLTLTITSGAETGDRLAVRHQGTNAGQISVTTTNIRYGNVIIATNSGGTGTNALVITFNTSAVNAAVQVLARSLTFENVSNNPANSSRVVKFELTDGKGGTNALTTQTISLVCPDAIDAMVLFDVSVSMVAHYTNGILAGYDTNRFWMAKAAASNFVGTLEFPGDRAGLISFAGGAQIRVPLTNNGPAVQASIYTQTNQNGTILDPAIHLARTNFTGSGSNTLRVMLVLSDGEEAPYSNWTNTIAAANAAKDADIRIITVAFYSGWDVHTNATPDGGTNLMKAIASSERDFYLAPSFNDMQSNFTAVARSLCRGNEFPTIAITSPTNATSFDAPANTIITMAASDDGSVTNVALYIGSTNVANFTAPPYAYNWTNVLGGSYALKAVAWDNTGQTSTSSVVNVTVVKQLPEISIVAPTNATHFAAVMNLLVRAAATDVDGYITNVTFYTNNVQAAIVTNPPFRFPWTNLPGLTNVLRVHAVAWDNDGQSTKSATNTFVVDACSQIAVSSLTLSTNTILGGSNVTATVTLVSNALSSGQVVGFQCSDPNVSIPAAVLVPFGTNKATVVVETFTLATNGIAAIRATTPTTTNTVNLTIQATGYSTTRHRNVCGPMDVAVLFDVSTSMGTSLEAVKSNAMEIVKSVEFSSGMDYRLALVSFDSNVNVKVEFGLTNGMQFKTAVSNLTINGAAVDEPSDEALNTVINSLAAAGRGGRQVGEFTNGFRLQAKKLVILITDEAPYGFAGSPAAFEIGVDDVSAHQRAVDAALKHVQISSIFITNSHVSFGAQAASAMADYAFVTGGLFVGLNETNLHLVPLAIQSIVSQCGADAGEVISTRDDVRQQSFTAMSLNNSTPSGVAVEPATFDLSGVGSSVMAAHLRRSGQLRLNFGSQFDLSLGAASFLDTNLQSYASPTRAAHLVSLGSAYATNWHLPFSFFSDIRGYIGGLYPLALVDRVSSVCGNNFEVIDTPQLDSPLAKNTLTLKSLAAFEIAQGRCRDFLFTGTNAPCSSCGASWEIRLYDEVIASECSPHGWSVESDHGVYSGVNICAPSDAVAGNRYEARFREGANSRSGYFSVVPAGAQSTSPVLKPVELSHPLCSSNMVVTVTVSLDAPAQGDGAYVAMSSVGITNSGIPGYVHIPPGQSSVEFSFRPTVVSSNTAFSIIANYNGERQTTGKVVVETTPVGVPGNVMAQVESRRIAVSWSPVPQATSYNIWRAPDGFFSSAALLESGIKRVCFVDENPSAGTNCYFVEAVNLGGTNVSASTNLNYCQTFTSSGVLRPRIIPHGGRFNDFAWATVTCETTNAALWCSTNGLAPVPDDWSCCFPVTNGVKFKLTASWQLIAQGFVGSTTSLLDRADFHIAQPTLLGCGSNVTSMLATTNQPSVLKGSGHYGARYSFAGRKGDVVTISVASTDFDPDLNLTDPNGQLVLQNGYPLTLVNGFSPKLVHTLRDTGTYIFEVTSAFQFATGSFTVSVNCTPSPELDVLFGTTNLTNGFSFDLGLKTNGATAQLTLKLTNSGSATLTFNSITLTPTNLFTNSPLTITSLATNSATNFTVYYRALSNGPWTGTLTLDHNDDPDDSPGGYELDTPFVVQFASFVNPTGTPPTVTLTNLSNGQVLTTPPTLTIGATATATASSVTQVFFRATGPAGVVQLGAVTASPWRVNWSNAPGGNYTLQAVVMDSGGRMGLSAPTNIVVNNPPLAVQDRFSVFTGSTNNFLEVLANDTDANGHTLTITNNLLTGPGHGFATVSGGGVLYAPSNSYTGHDSFSYVVYDSLGARATGVVALAVFPQFGQMADPVSLITAPSNNVEIAEAIAINGTASHQFLQFWELQYRRRGSAPTPWKTFAEGTDAVTNGFLATFDPTGLPNGIYQIKLKTVAWTDAAVETSITLRLGEGPKIGHFTLSFTDLQIPVSGLPITLTRSYDSRNTDSGDFGAGWNLDVNSVRLEKSGIMGEGWEAVTGTGFQGFQTCVYETEPHVVTITFPGDKVFRFAATLELAGFGNNCAGSGYLGQSEGNISYTPLPGTLGTLRELGTNTLLKVGFTGTNHPVTFHDARDNWSELSDTNFFGAVYDPKEFEFTALDGRKFQFNAAGKVTKMTDRVGNSLTFSSAGVIHSSGKSVKFVRDAAGRITEIYDPNGLTTNGVTDGPAALSYTYDAAGNLVAVHQLAKRNTASPTYLTTGFGYNDSKFPHYLTDIDDPRGIRAIRNEYGDDGRLKSMTDASGKTINYIHSISNRMEIIVDRMGRTNTFVYDTKGNVTESVNPLNHTNRFVYDAKGNQLTHTDPLGHTTTNVYDAYDNLLSVTLPHKPGENPEAFTTRFTYAASGELTSTTLPTGAVISNTVDVTTGNLLTMRAGTNLITSLTYNANGNVTAEGDRFSTNTFAYDAFGNALQMTNTLGQVIESGYDANGNLTNLVNGSSSSSFQYDALGREAISDYGNGITLSNNFESHLDWTSVDAPTIGHMERRFDEQGRLAGWKTVNGATPGFAYNANGQVEYETNSIGQVTYRQYDAAGRMTSMSNLTTGASSGSGYNAAGRRIAETNALGGFILYAYNPDGSLAAMTNIVLKSGTTNQFDTNVWLYTYETGGGCCGGNGATTAVKDPLDREITRVASPYGLPVQTIRRSSVGATGLNAATNFITYLSGMVSPEQEAEDYPTAITDEGGRTRNLDYNTSGNLRRATDLSGTAWWTNWFAGPNGQVSQVDSPTREKLNYYFGALDNVIALKFPDGNSMTNFFDSANRLNGIRLSSGALLTNFFDSAGRLTNWQARVSGSMTENVGLNYNANDAVTTMTDNTGATTNVFDAAGQLLGIDYPTGASVRHGHDLLGRVTSITNKASGGGATYVTRYAYDLLGRITHVVDHWNRTNQFEFDRVGRRTKRTLANGVVSEWQYNWKDQVTNLTHKTSGGTTLASFAYERAPGGEPTKIIREDNSYVELKHDAALRLTNEVYKTSGGSVIETIGYGYDTAGSRIRLINASGTFTNSIVAGYRIGPVRNASTGTTNETYEYDNGGRVTNIVRSGATLRLGYNTADQLTAVTNGATWVTYRHDGNGRRTVSTNSTGTVRRFLVAPTPGTDMESPQLVANTSGTLQQGYVFVGDEPLLRFDAAGNPVYYLEDATGSVVGLVSNGTSIATFNYDGFGNYRSVSGTTNAPTGTGGDFRFHGAWFEADTGLHNMRAREYDQITGRFLSRDPVEGIAQAPETFHPYVFANSNPFVFEDPAGTEFTVLGVSLSGGIQNAFNGLRTYGANAARRKGLKGLSNAFQDLVTQGLESFIPEGLLHNFTLEGIQFGEVVRKAFCEASGIPGWIFFEASLNRNGTPLNNGITCADVDDDGKALTQSVKKDTVRPDFIMSSQPLRSNSGIGKAWLIGDVKRTTATLARDYLERSSDQFDGIRNYARNHTYSRVAMFVTIARTKQYQYKPVQALLMKRCVEAGCLGYVQIIFPKDVVDK